MNAHCTGKVRFPTFEAAEKQAKITSARRDEPLTPYRCRSCEAYHIGRKIATRRYIRRDVRYRFLTEEEL